MRMLAALDVVDDVNGVAVDALQHGCRRGYRIGMRYGALAMTEHADTTAAVTTGRRIGSGFACLEDAVRD